MTGPRYGTPVAVAEAVTLVVQRNPGFMTLDGTNTWLLRDPSSASCVLVDPGQGPEQQSPAEPREANADEHLAALLAAADVSLVLITHRHHDHYGLAAAVREATGAPVRAVDPSLCAGGSPLADGEVIEAAGIRLDVLATPGHTADSTSFVLRSGSGGVAAVLTGDMILGRGTTVVAHPDGVLGPYLESMTRLRELGRASGQVTVLPGHGPVLPSLADVAQYYLEHRRARLEQVRSALAELGPEADARTVVEAVYADVDPVLWPAAELSVQAQLAYLRPPSDQPTA